MKVNRQAMHAKFGIDTRSNRPLCAARTKTSVIITDSSHTAVSARYGQS